MLALRTLLICPSNSVVDYHAYLNQLAVLSRREISRFRSLPKNKRYHVLRGDHHQHIIPWRILRRKRFIIPTEFSQECVCTLQQ